VWIAGATFSFIGMVVTLILRPGRGMSYEDDELDAGKVEVTGKEKSVLVDGQ
jgi:hypothetical protein